MNLDLYKYIYFVGIGGIGMSALARYFNANEKIVMGYDAQQTTLCNALVDEGIDIHYQDNIINIPQEIITADHNELLVVYTPAIPDNNQELSYFENNGYKIYKRAEVLGIISQQSYTIAVAGTHGKTTTCTMLAHILQEAGKQSTAFLGGISKNFNSNLLLANKGNILIVEADEYDRSFLHLNPDVAIITSIDKDHLDIYEDYSKLEQAFIQFTQQIKQNGLLLVEADINVVFEPPENGALLTYSNHKKADYYADNIKIVNGKMRFDMTVLDLRAGMTYKNQQNNLELNMAGKHNVNNAVAAVAIACYLGLNCEEITIGLKSFKGIKRRFDQHICTDQLIYIDDYAHHPEEINATVLAVKEMYPNRKITLIFQPHLYSRTQDLAAEFATALSLVDELIILDIYPAREEKIEGVDSKMLAELCRNELKETCSKSELLSILKTKELDVLLTMGAGDISTLVEPIKHMLN